MGGKSQPDDSSDHSPIQHFEKSIFGPYGTINDNTQHIYYDPRSPELQARLRVASLLADTAYRRCKNERAILRLDDRTPMPVQWSLTERDVSDSSENIFGQAQSVKFDVRSDKPHDVAKQFLALDRGRLVILGETGSGKTVLAEAIQWQLLQDEERSKLVPVLLSVNSWDIDKFPTLREWLIYRLRTDFPEAWQSKSLQKSMPGELYDNNFVLPILDGLDEVNMPALSKIVRALNEHLTTHDSLVLTCRTETYSELVERWDIIKCAVVIEAHPLTPDEAADYLKLLVKKRDTSSWQPILDTIRTGEQTPLVDVCSHPLGLWLLRTVYLDGKGDDRSANPSPLDLLDFERFPDAASLKLHLFDSLIPTVLARRTVAKEKEEFADPRRPRRNWSTDAAVKWLAHTARMLEGGSDLRWWRLYRDRSLLPESGRRAIFDHGSAISAVAAIGVVGLIAVFRYIGGPELPLTLLFMYVPLLLIILPVSAMVRIRSASEPHRSVRRSLIQFVVYEIKRRSKSKEFIYSPLGFGVLGGVMAWLASHPIGIIGKHIHWLVTILPMSGGERIAVCTVAGAAIGLVAALGDTLAKAVPEWISPKKHVSSCQKCGAVAYLGDLPSLGWDPLLMRCGQCGWSCDCPSCMALHRMSTSWQSPVSTYRDSRRRAIIRIPASIAYMAVLMSLGLWIFSAPNRFPDSHTLWQFVDRLPMYAFVGTLAAVPVGLGVAVGREPAWYGYFFVSKWSALRGNLPWRTMDFLEDAHRVGLLRTSGASYQFRHVELKEHLANSGVDVPGT